MLVNLKTAIALRRTTQAELAWELHVSTGLLSEVVRELRQPGADLRRRISEALQADEGWLFTSIRRIPSPAAPRESPANA